MPVYVDNAFIQATVPNGGRKVTSRWCHMMADTREEIDAMALRIGLRLQWRQGSGSVIEHYDLTEPRRAAALAAGAVEITWREGADLTERKMRIRDLQEVEGATFEEELAAIRTSSNAAPDRSER